MERANDTPNTARPVGFTSPARAPGAVIAAIGAARMRLVGATMANSVPPASSDADEVARLRERVAQLEAEQGAVRGPRWRTALALVMLLIGGILFPIGVVGIWAQRTVNDTTRYVQTVAPLLEDAQVQNVLADEITTALFNQVDVKNLLEEALPPKAAPLSGSIENGLQSFVRGQVLNALETPAAQEAWNRANEELQSQIIAALKGEPSGSVSISGDTIVLDTGDLIEEIKSILVQRGFSFLDRIPVPAAADRQIVLVESAQVTKVQTIYRLSDIASNTLIWFAMALIFGAVLVSNRRRQWLLASGVVIALGASLVGLTVIFGRDAALASVGAGDPSFQASVFDILTRFLRGLARAGLALGIVIAVGAWLAGPSSLASGIRSGVGAAEAALARACVSYVPQLASFGRWVAQWRAGLRVLIVGVSVLSVLGRADISVGRIWWTVAFALVAWVVVDTFAFMAPRAPSDDDAPHADATAAPETSAVE